MRPSATGPPPRALRAAILLLTTRLIWPAPTPSVAPSFDADDGVRFDIFHDAPGEQEVLELGRGWERAW